MKANQRNLLDEMITDLRGDIEIEFQGSTLPLPLLTHLLDSVRREVKRTFAANPHSFLEITFRRAVAAITPRPSLTLVNDEYFLQLALYNVACEYNHVKALQKAGVKNADIA